ncbi:T9SS type A sorting domain-containing protein [Hymenobacter sp. ASUV-10]|uniref:T9SS type A sorting domain-containing protein n=1 Tax=Hymenobacter aranciens TaxID=3063996 RepID=A0ABT9BFA8_9BACT|nr:T9SS type A sorting domain-containing protein [Hymenobacter sp. ASUV-10]MDO7876945.1 T9SS type A sorting domain-containing protein [Hymenobacter sp. ASUV-10]
MRQYFYSLFATALGLAAVPAIGQVSPIIDRTDMPVPLDTLRLSVAGPILPAGTPPLTQRGANQTWNYSALTANSQRVARFVAVNTLPAFYQLSFGALGGSNRATVASPQAFPLPANAPVALPFTDPYQFYNTSAAGTANQSFRSVGFGATVTGGLQVPVTYASQAQQDVIYRLPLSFASAADSSNSFFSISVPGTGYLSQRRKRVNRPDAWGTLTTPFGTFQTVRVVTRLLDHDSLAFGAIPGTAINPPLTREYKWLAKTHHVPLLTITTQQVLGIETITGVEYRDIYRRIIRTGTRDAATDAVLTAYPNPSSVGNELMLTVPAGSGELTVSATDLAGRRLFSRQLNGNSGLILLEPKLLGNFHGMALLTVTTAHGTATRRIVRQ